MDTITPDKTTLIENFLSSGEVFVNLVSSLPENLIDASAAPGEWTIREIVHHVADDADLWCFAFKKAIACPGVPVRFEGFPGNERWFEALGFRTRPVAPALELIRAHRCMMAGLAACAPQDWSLANVELFGEQGTSLGKWSIDQIFSMLTNHLQEHIATIETIKTAAGVQSTIVHA